MLKLLEKVKRYLRITWDREDIHIQEIIDAGQVHLNELTDAQLDFASVGLPQTLLLDYCRYVYNNASEYFTDNYRADILRLQLQAGVAAEVAVQDET